MERDRPSVSELVCGKKRRDRKRGESDSELKHAFRPGLERALLGGFDFLLTSEGSGKPVIAPFLRQSIPWRLGLPQSRCPSGEDPERRETLTRQPSASLGREEGGSSRR